MQQANKMFQVVETVEGSDKFVTAVPKSWVVNGSILLWPLRRKDMLNGRKNCIDPEDDWNQIQCRLIFDGIDSWEQALQKEKTAELLSSDENEFEQSPQFCDSVTISDLNTLMSEIISDDKILDGPAGKIQSFPPASAKSPQDVESLTTQANMKLLAEKQRQLEASLECLRSETSSIKQMLADFVAKTEVTLDLIVNKMCVDMGHKEKPEVFPENLLPISTQEALDQVEERIGADPSFKRLVIRKLSTFGGVNGNKTIRTISKLLFDDRLLSEFSRLGTANKKKFCMYKNVFAAVVSAVRDRYPKYSDIDAASFFKTYLKQARFRMKLLNNNNERPATTTTTTATATATTTTITTTTTTTPIATAGPTSPTAQVIYKF